MNYTYSECRLLEAYGDRNLVTISTPQRILYRMLKAIHFSDLDVVTLWVESLFDSENRERFLNHFGPVGELCLKTCIEASIVSVLLMICFGVIRQRKWLIR